MAHIELDFMQPDDLDVYERVDWPMLAFDIVAEVGPSGHTVVRISGEHTDIERYLFEGYCDDPDESDYLETLIEE